MNSIKQRCLGIVTIVTVMSVGLTSANAYEPTTRDTLRMWDMTERLIQILQKNDWSDSMYNTIQAGLGRTAAKATSSDSVKAILSGTQQNLSTLYAKYNDDAYFGLTRTFRAQYDGDMLTSYDDPKILENCFKHYPIVDAYAQRVGKPTPLLMAMWFIETSCAMNNPANGDGLFQIVANNYAEGPITTVGLLGQLEDFDRFMDNKRNWYYKKNPDAPKELAYTTFTYDSLQTFAALYNGIDLKTGIKSYPLLNGNPYYFLGNSSEKYRARRDGLLVFFLKLSKMEEHWFGRD